MKKNLINRLIELSNIEVSMSMDQFKMYKNGEVNLFEIKMINELDAEIGVMRYNNKKLYKYLVVGLAFALTLSIPTTAHAVGLDSIDILGNTFLTIVRRGMYWVCLIKSIIDIGKEVQKGGDNMGNIGKIIMKYVLAFASLYIMPYLFDLVRDSF